MPVSNQQGRRARPFTIAAALFAAMFLLISCGSSDDSTEASDSKVSLTVYSGQHEEFGQALAEAFETETGIHIDMRAGKDGELVNQLIEEGDRSKADVFLTEEPGPMAQLADRDLLTAVSEDALAKPDERFTPSDGTWLPWAARSRVMFYNPEVISEDELPDSILDLADPEWESKFAYAPSGAFKSTTTYLLNTIGEQETLEWLKAIKANGVNEQKNGKVRDAVEAGKYAFGLSNHYYWYILAKDRGGEANVTSRVHYMNNEDAGSLMLASGAGILKSTSHAEEAQQFLDWLVTADGGQQIVADQSPQFPLVEGVTSAFDLPTIASLTFPALDQSSFEDVDAANELLKQSGIV